MPISKVANVITESAIGDMDQFLRTGVIHASHFALCDDQDRLKQIKFSTANLATNTSVTIAPQSSSSGTFSLPNAAGGTIAQLTDIYVSPYQYAAPTAGTTVTIAANTPSLVLEPAGTLATLTIVLPTTPPDGFVQSISSTAIVTVLTVSGGGSDTIVNTITSIAAAGFASYIYKSATFKWYRIG